MRRPRPVLVPVLAGILALTGCGSSGEDPATEGATTTTGVTVPAGEIMVGAGTSLTEAFTAIGERIGTAGPDTTVTFTFDNSVSLSTQVLNGAPLQVYATPEDANLQRLVDAGRVGTPTEFATDTLVIVTKPGNPQGLTGLADLPGAGMVSLGGTSIPVGKLSTQVLDAAGVSIPESSITRGQTVKAVLTAVAQGDADAGIVFATDALAAGDTVAPVPIPTESNATTSLVIAPVIAESGASPSAGAIAFIDWVLSPEGQRVLTDAGFGPMP